MSISNNAVSRLSLYRSALDRFKSYGSVMVYSCDIAEALGFTAAQVRKDFAMFKFPGKKKVGYNVETLLSTIDGLLQKNQANRVIVCGSQASFFFNQLAATNGIAIAGVFDTQPQASSRDNGTETFAYESLVQFVTDHAIRFAIIATAAHEAQRTLDLLVLAGIKGVLNLSGAEIKGPRRCHISTVNVVREFEKMVYFVTAKNTGDRG